jgi:putative membrane protein
MPLHPFQPRVFFFHPGWFWGFGVIVVLAQLALLVGAILLVVALLRRDRRHLPPPPPPRSPSLAILEDRYARGEISREEFLERRSVLTGSLGPAGTAGPNDPTAPVPPSGT